MMVTGMVKEYLQQNGYDGLCNTDGECGCSLEDLAPCGEMSDACAAAYKCECEDCQDKYDCDVVFSEVKCRNSVKQTATLVLSPAPEDCFDCPLSHDGGMCERSYCCAPGGKDFDSAVHMVDGLPDWCPLVITEVD